jgi:hypothetical protein
MFKEYVTLQVIAFAVDVIITGSAYSVSGPVATVCIYDPHRRYQAWRFLSYVLVHIGYVYQWSMSEATNLCWYMCHTYRIYRRKKCTVKASLHAI